ncbi:MAG: hypothetical protein P8X53_11210 [Chromatiales bacterium]|jgi:hypothetical protein
MAPSVVGLTKDLDSLERRINGNKGKIERPGSIVGMLPGLAEIPPEELVGVMFEPSSYDFSSLLISPTARCGTAAISGFFPTRN